MVRWVSNESVFVKQCTNGQVILAVCAFDAMSQDFLIAFLVISASDEGRMISERKSGVLLHVTSLPSYGGIGDMGPAAFAFVDYLVQGKQRLWQVLPLSPTGYGNSPYAALSAFAGNPLLLSLEKLVEHGWLSVQEIEGLAGHDGPVDFDRAGREKLPLIERAANRFLESGDVALRGAFERFCEQAKDWLEDYACYAVLRRQNAYQCWCDWPEHLAARQHDAMQMFRRTYAEDIFVEKAIQFLFMEQWKALQQYAKKHDVEIMGDMAIFVNYDSADVWANRENFDLKDDMSPRVVSGVPPDYFSATGQRWGNPLYRWKYMQERGFDWWCKRVKRQLELYDLLRLDHFRGFEAYWEIDAAEETAVHGRWVQAPGRALFETFQSIFGDPLPLVAEDLGVITPRVDQLREEYAMPGMRVLQFGFSDRGAHLHLPHRFVTNTVVYTGTHDNNTTLGWWLENASAQEQENALEYLGPLQHPNDIVWQMVRCAEKSVAALCIVPLQDLLHLGSEGRMNTPAGTQGNWAWRYHPDALHPDIAKRLANIVELTDRDAFVEDTDQDEAKNLISETATPNT